MARRRTMGMTYVEGDVKCALWEERSGTGWHALARDGSAHGHQRRQ